MNILGIDPGPEKSGFVEYFADIHTVGMRAILPNAQVLDHLEERTGVVTENLSDALAIERSANYGMPVGQDMRETDVWSGQFIHAWGKKKRLLRIYRREVKMHLCNSMRAKDANIRRALLDMFSKTGGGKTPEVGTKAKPGPLFGMKADMWAALGVAVTAAAQIEKENDDGE